jgi:hypothetical protein
MQKQFRIPVIFLFIASCIGLLLRWYFVSPIAWLKYPYWVHAHSHIMFLGWIFNTFYIGYVVNYALSDRKYKVLFIIIQILLSGMLISFPLQGYGVCSIALSVLHTIAIYFFCFWIFRDFKKLKPVASILHAKISLLLFLVSSVGPFALGALMANGLGQSKWYYFAVYYYLHFQYNGVFIFGLLSFFYKLLEERNTEYNSALAKKSGVLLFTSLFPGYFLSTLWASPELLFNIIGCIGALVQLWALYCFIKVARSCNRFFLNPNAKLLMTLSVSAFIIKSFLQFISAHPLIAKLAFDVRPFTIAYLHLVLIGVVTFFLLAWYMERGITVFRSKFTIILLLIGFIGSELCMIIAGIPNFSSMPLQSYNALLLFFSICLVLAFGSFLQKALVSV